jgi:hypothetical protein
MIRKLACIILAIALTQELTYAQVGGNRSYEFLNVPYTARLSGLGGVNVSQVDQDVNLFLSNPALTGDTVSGYASANYLSYFADIGLSTFTYSQKVDQVGGMLSVGIQHIGLGSMDGRDASGVMTQSFSSGETAITISHSRQSGNFRMGANLKWINSNIANYRSSALLFDLGGVFVHPDKQLSIGMTIKNIGFFLTDYTEESNSKPPLDVQVGATFKPEHMPFRFSISAYQFANGDREIAYFEPASGLQSDEPGRFDKFARHFVIGTELLISNNVNLRFGYNHLVRQELRLDTKAGGAGISYGFMFRVKAIEFAYSKGGYHVAGGAHHFTLIFNTNSVLRRIRS